MTKRKTLIGSLTCAVCVLVVGAFMYDMFVFGITNNLGISLFDLWTEGNPDIEVIRENATTAADEYLVEIEQQLTEACGKPYNLVLDLSLAKKMECRSSFSFYCWCIALPYSLETESGKTYTVVIHLSDEIENKKHDLSRLHGDWWEIFDANGSKIADSNLWEIDHLFDE